MLGINISPLQVLNLGVLAPPAPVAPSAPTLTIIPGNGQLTISWVDGYNGGAAISSHNLYVGTTSGGESTTAIVVNGSSPYVLTGLTNGQIEYLQMAAVNSVGAGARSAEVTGTPQVITRTYGAAAFSLVSTVDGSGYVRGTMNSSTATRSK